MIGTLIKLLATCVLDHQKSAAALQEIPQDNRIHLRSFSEKAGYITTVLYYSWWTNCQDFSKEWDCSALEEYITASHSLHRSFYTWRGKLSDKGKLAYLSEFIAAHKPMIRNEMEEYYHQNAMLKCYWAFRWMSY